MFYKKYSPPLKLKITVQETAMTRSFYSLHKMLHRWCGVDVFKHLQDIAAEGSECNFYI